MKIKKFENISSVGNYVVSYTKETTKSDVDISISAYNVRDLISKLEKHLSKDEFDSIFKIEMGSMPFG